MSIIESQCLAPEFIGIHEHYRALLPQTIYLKKLGQGLITGAADDDRAACYLFNLELDSVCNAVGDIFTSPYGRINDSECP